MEGQKIQRRFPAVRILHKKRLPPILIPFSDNDDSDDEDLDSPVHGIHLPSSLPKILPQISSSSSVATPSPSGTSLPSAPVPTIVLPAFSSFFSTPVPSSKPSSSTSTTPKPTQATSTSPSTNAAAATEASSQSTAQSTKSRAPVGPIVGVILAIFVIAIPLGIYLYRRRSVKGRMRMRGWVTKSSGAAIISPWVDYKEKWAINESSPAAVGSKDRVVIPPGAPLANGLPYIAPPKPPLPPAAYLGSNDATPPLGSPRAVQASLATPITGAMRVLPADAPEYATVASTYIPTLPDELSIKPGDVLRILAEYDDGWALCLSTRGEKGMVPLECFGQATSAKTEVRKSSRYSSAMADPYEGIV